MSSRVSTVTILAACPKASGAREPVTSTSSSVASLSVVCPSAVLLTAEPPATLSVSVVVTAAERSVATLSTPMVTTRPTQAKSAQRFRVNWRKRSALRWLKSGLYMCVNF